ncbi:MAG: nucleotidyl transferase AbiEii/AbiGii toxin family protein [Parachlamydiaceae bacterium]
MNKQALIDKIHKISTTKEITFNECWKQLILDRFLSRLARSEQSKKFIFKGGFLLSYMIELGRETKDLDFLLTKINASESEIIDAVKEIAQEPLDDGFSYKYNSIEILNQPHMNYPGYRINLDVQFSNMKNRIQIDVGVGDVVTPIRYELETFEHKGQKLFENDVSLFVYPPETIYAEKLETILSKGSFNSRMKDYHDLFLLSRNPQLFQKNTFQKSIKVTFDNRNTMFKLINFTENELLQLQSLWNYHLKDIDIKAKDLNIPKNIHEVIKDINMFLIQMEISE